MKDERKQHKKHHESTIGKIIYGFLLFMPLFAIGTTCLISTFNMASKEESEIHYKYETNEVNSVNDLVVGRIYKWSYDFTNEEREGNWANFISIFFNESTYLLTEETSNIQVVMNYSISNNRLAFANNSLLNNNINYYFPNNKTATFYVIYYDIGFKDSYTNYSISDFNVIEDVELHNVEPQDVFYNSVTKVQESPLFNWTTNTGIYSVLNNTCNSLGITTTFVPLLLAYWLIISVMYFLYDIVLIILNILHRKIHELQESI